jgi:endonuclease III
MAATAKAKRHATEVARALAAAYPDAACSLDHRSPLELLVSTILSAQCTDKRVNEVTKSLFCKYPTAADYARTELAELESDVQPTGFFRNKARNIRDCCRVLLERHDGRVPKTMEELVELPGVGRKTANVVLGAAYGMSVGVVVDTHVARLSRRLGLSAEKDPAKIERDLMGLFAPEEWIALSHRLIQHGRRCCTARNPTCGPCPLGAICPRIGVAE